MLPCCQLDTHLFSHSFVLPSISIPFNQKCQTKRKLYYIAMHKNHQYHLTMLPHDFYKFCLVKNLFCFTQYFEVWPSKRKGSVFVLSDEIHFDKTSRISQKMTRLKTIARRNIFLPSKIIKLSKIYSDKVYCCKRQIISMWCYKS